MTEVLRTDDTHAYANRELFSINVDADLHIDPASPPRIEDLDEAYKKRELKHARIILN